MNQRRHPQQHTEGGGIQGPGLCFGVTADLKRGIAVRGAMLCPTCSGEDHLCDECGGRGWCRDDSGSGQ